MLRLTLWLVLFYVFFFCVSSSVGFAKFLYMSIAGQHHPCLFEKNGGGGVGGAVTAVTVANKNGMALIDAASAPLPCCQQNILKNIERKQSGDTDEKELLENEIKHLLEIDALRRKLEETERAMSRIISQMGNVPHKGQVRTFALWMDTRQVSFFMRENVYNFFFCHFWVGM